MNKKFILIFRKIFSKIFQPPRVFIALLIVVCVWLLPVTFQNTKVVSPEVVDAQGLYGGACGRLCHFGCCINKTCQKCPPGEDPPPVYPPTISGTLNCTSWGNNGWCVGGLALNLIASDPQGEPIIISGDVDGTLFACPDGDTSCLISITDEGTGSINYTVNSGTGLSGNGSTNYKLDMTTPQISGTIDGTLGSNNFYISSVTATTSANDNQSGVQTLDYSLDNGDTWNTYIDPVLFTTNGQHSIIFRACDYAGNCAQTSSQAFNIDTITPSLNLAVTGITGSDNWYITPAQITLTASDDGSNLASFICDVNSTAADCASIILADGVHQINAKACDLAGLCTTDTRTINVDTTTPALSIDITGALGHNSWYKSAVQIMPNVSDTGSGFDSLKASMDGGPMIDVSSPLSFVTDGIHSYQIVVCDKAGLCTDTLLQQIKIDTIPPILTLPSLWTLGNNASYTAEDSGSGLSHATVRIEGDQYQDSLSGNTDDEELYWDGKLSGGQTAPAGDYEMIIKLYDAAGNETRETTMVRVNFFSSFLAPFTVKNPIPATPTVINTPVLTPVSTPFGGITANIAITPQTNTSTSGNTVNLFTNNTTSVSFGVSPSTTPIGAVQNNGILWGAVAAAAAVGAFVAEAQRRREEELAAKQAADRAAFLARIEEDGRKNDGRYLSYTNRAKAYQASLDNFKVSLVEKGLSPEEAAAEKTKAILSGKIPYVTTVAANHDRNAAIESKLAREDAAEEARWLAMKEVEKKKADELVTGLAAYYNAMRQGEQEAQANVMSDKSSTWLSLQLEAAKEVWNDFVDKWTTPSESTDLFEPPQWLNTASPLIKFPVEFLDSVADSSISAPSDSRIVNAFKNITSFTRGAATQFADDITLGLFGWYTGLQPENGDQFFQEGREIGRTLSTVSSVIETAAGLALLTSGISLIPPTMGGTAACAAATGPAAVLCFGVGGFALAAEASAVAGGALLAGHGGAVFWNNANHPLQIRGNGGSSSLLKTPVPGKNNTIYIKSKTNPGPALDYEVRVTGKSDPSLAVEVTGVEFDWYSGDTLIDAKNAGETRSWYDVSKLDNFTQTVKVNDILAKAKRQVNAMQGTGFTNIEWRVADQKVAEALKELFRVRELTNITVVYFP